MLVLLLVLALASGIGLAFATLGGGQRSINVFWALASLLGPYLLTLLGWALGLLAGGKAAGAFGRLWLWPGGKLARDARAVHLAPVLLVLPGRRRLACWGLGALVRGLWLLGLLTTLVMLLGLLATRRYGFVWETTILGSDTFITSTQVLGALPVLLGFPLPDAELIRASGDAASASEAVRHAWTGWPVGVLLVYGVLSRALLGLFCLWHWERGLADLDLDLDDPGYSLLCERSMPASERLGVSDATLGQLLEPQGGQPGQEAAGAVLVVAELDDRRPWPPKLAEGVTDAGILDDGQQRRHLFEQLTRYPPACLAIARDPHCLSGRGIPALLGELTRCATSTRIWLLQTPPGEALDNDRLGDWYAVLERLQLPHGETSPLAWPKTGHD